MSEPPPGAVLMTNSTGCVGWISAAAEAEPELVGVAEGAFAVAQAERVTSAAARIAAVRITDLVMTRTSMEQVRTGVSKGIRAYWNAQDEQLYALHLKEHYLRLHRSCRIMRIGLPYTADDLVGITLELLRKCNYREDAYIRPIAYKSSPVIGVRLHDLEDSFTVFAVPFGTYIDIDRGISCSVSSWRRTDDNAIPARSKITGAYVNAALAKTEAQEAGFDEAIVLTQDGHVSEGSAENLFLVRDGTLMKIGRASCR